jgi:hypothetical protein
MNLKLYYLKFEVKILILQSIINCSLIERFFRLILIKICTFLNFSSLYLLNLLTHINAFRFIVISLVWLLAVLFLRLSSAFYSYWTIYFIYKISETFVLTFWLLKIIQSYFICAFLLLFIQRFFFVLFPSWDLFNLLSSCKIFDWFARVLYVIWVWWTVANYHILIKLFFMNHHQLVFVIEIFINVVANFSLFRVFFGLSVITFRVSIVKSELIILVESDRLFPSVKHILRLVMNWLLFKITAGVSVNIFLMHIFYCVLGKSLGVFPWILCLYF